MALTERNEAIDVTRGLAMLLVIYGHTLEMFFMPFMRIDHAFDFLAFEIYRLIYSFHMPAFYFISGMTATNLTARPFRKILATAFTLIILADLVHLLGVCPYIYMKLHDGAPIIEIVRTVIRPIVAGWDFSIVVLWFLVSLAIVQILAWLLVHSNLAGKVLIWVVAVAVFLLSHYDNKLYFQAQSWAVGMVFFMAGWGAMRYDRFAKGQPRGLLLLYGCLILAALFFSYPLNRGCLFDSTTTCSTAAGTKFFLVHLLYGRIGFVPLFFFTAFAGTGALVFIALTIRETRVASAIAWVGRNTLGLLILNGFVLRIEGTLAKRIPINPLGVPSAVWSVLFVVAQLAVFPISKPVLTKLHEWSRHLSDLLLVRFEPSPPVK